MNHLRFKILPLLATILFACTNTPPDAQTNTSKKLNTKLVAPTFNKDSAYYFVEKQVSFGPRVISSKGWENCAIWLEKTLKRYTPDVTIQEAPIKTYDGKSHKLKNIIASFSAEKNNRIALFAHWDSRHIADHDTENREKPILGANDGGSGVAVLLEIARQLSKKIPKIGIDIILFDAEDYGQPEDSSYPIMQDSWCLGSQYWSKNPHKPNYYAQYGILLDMVGAKNATFRHEQISSYYASNILQKVWRKAHRLGFGNYFVFENAPQIIDDHYYVNLITAIPTIDIIEYDPTTENNFNKHWHTHNDNMDNINKETLNAVGQTLLEILYSE
tara:strand:- start:36921 stop:37910 length:990 start_codon:yes stop_codon:yes gene_type:complete